MKVTVCSAFRNAARYLDRYGVQMAGLRKALARRGDAFSCIWGEGDSTDDTKARLLRFCGQFDAEIVDCAHGGPVYGPVVDAQRFRQLAHVWGCIWERIPATADVVLFLESDLVWQPVTMLALIDRVTQGLPAVAPMVMDGPTSFYDTLAFVFNREHFQKSPPYHPGIAGATEPIWIDSAGSCLAIRGTLARKLVWNDNVIMGLCDQIHMQSEKVFLDPTLEVIHP